MPATAPAAPFAPTDFEPLDTSDFEPLPAATAGTSKPASNLARMNGPIPEGTPIMGGPIPIVPLMGSVLPHAISSAVAYGADKLGQAMGLPDWANAALGIGAGGLTAGAGRLAQAAGGAMDNVPPGAGKFANTILKKVVPGYKWFDAAREALKPEAPAAPPAFEPFKPSAGVARKMPYGGPVDTSGGPSYGPPVRAGGPITPIEPPAAPEPIVPPEPFKPSSDVARKMKYGGPADTSGGQSYGPPKRAGGPITPVEPPPAPKPVKPPEPFKPNKINPVIKKKMHYGGSDDPYNAPSYRNPPRRMGGGGGGTADVNTVGAPPAKPATPAPPASREVITTGQPPAPGEISVRQHGTNVKVNDQIENKAKNLAQYLRSKGGNTEHLDRIIENPSLTRQYLDEAHEYGQKVGNPVPKSGYKGLDAGSDSHKLVRQKILDMIEEEKSKP